VLIVRLGRAAIEFVELFRLEAATLRYNRKKIDTHRRWATLQRLVICCELSWGLSRWTTAPFRYLIRAAVFWCSRHVHWTRSSGKRNGSELPVHGGIMFRWVAGLYVLLGLGL
jgi:hypothetical protein